MYIPRIKNVNAVRFVREKQNRTTYAVFASLMNHQDKNDFQLIRILSRFLYVCELYCHMC